MRRTEKGLFGNDDWEQAEYAFYRRPRLGPVLMTAAMWILAVLASALLLILILGFSKIWGA